MRGQRQSRRQGNGLLAVCGSQVSIEGTTRPDLLDKPVPASDTTTALSIAPNCLNASSSTCVMRHPDTGIAARLEQRFICHQAL